MLLTKMILWDVKFFSHGSFFDTEEEAEVALEEQFEVANAIIKKNLKKEITKLQKRLDKMEK